MPNTKTSALAALTAATLADTDELVVVDKSDTTMAASGTNKKVTVADARAALGGAIFVDVTWDLFGAVGDGVADDRAAIQAAIDFASTRGGIVWFPVPAVAYKCNSPLNPKSNVHLKGPGGPYVGNVLILSQLSSLFVFTATVYNMELEGLTLRSDSGHIVDQAGFNISQSKVKSCSFLQNATGSSIWRTGGGDAIDFHVSGCYSKVPVASTVPGWHMLSNANAINVCSWKQNRFENSGDYQIHIETGGTAFCQDITIADNNFQQCLGGEVRLLSCRAVTIERCAGYDGGTYTKDRYRVGKSTTGTIPQNIRFVQVSRRNPGVLGAGIYDINAPTSSDGNAITVESCNGAINLGGVANMILGNDGTSPATVLSGPISQDTISLTAGIIEGRRSIVKGTAGTGYVEFLAEQSADPAAPAANGARLFTKDNGAGKTQLCVRFATGAVQVIATEP